MEIQKIQGVEVNYELINGTQKFDASFWWNDGTGVKQYSCILSCWLKETFDDYCEGGYVVGQSIDYEWIIDDIVNVTFVREYKDLNGEWQWDDCTLNSYDAKLKTIWITQLEDFMTKDGNWNYYDPNE